MVKAKKLTYKQFAALGVLVESEREYHTGSMLRSEMNKMGYSHSRYVALEKAGYVRIWGEYYSSTTEGRDAFARWQDDADGGAA